MNFVTLSLLIPLATAIICMIFWRAVPLQRLVAISGMLAYFGATCGLIWQVTTAGIQVVTMGNWPAPYGIVMVADMTSAIMVFATGVIGLTVAIYSLSDIDQRRQKYGYFAFLHLMIFGVTGAFMTGDLFNMFVFFEVMLISSFVLMTLGGERGQMEGAVKYVTLNLISSIIFLSGVGILYAKTGTLNLADLAIRVGDSETPAFMTVTAMMFLVAFGVKAGIFPLYFWLPASYHTPPVSVSAAFAGLLTKVGVYAMIRIFTLVFLDESQFTHALLLILAALTMVSGILGAVVQFDFRRLLSFHIISQIGYIVLGLALFTPLALAGALYYTFHNILAKSNLFLASGVAARYQNTFYLKRMGGLYAKAPWLSLLFFISAMSLAGIPPLSGFFAKFSIVKAALAGDSQFKMAAAVMVVVALTVGLGTLFSMTKIWAEAFWKDAPEGAEFKAGILSPKDKCYLYGPIAALALFTIALGLAPGFFFGFALEAGHQLMDPSLYINAVMERKP